MHSPLMELLTPKQSSAKVEEDLQTFNDRCAKIVECGCGVSIPDNPLGHLHFTATEVLSYLASDIQPDRLVIHLNTFHRKTDLDDMLDQVAGMGVRRLVCVSGDGGPRLPKLDPADLNCSGNTVTSVELLRYINTRHRDGFTCGVAFNPYEPPEHELEKLRLKIEAGAQFIVTQPVMEHHAHVQELSGYRLPVWIGAWMSKRIDIFYQCIGREPPEATEFNPFDALKRIRAIYPAYALYLTQVSFKQDWCGMLREFNLIEPADRNDNAHDQ